MKTLQTDIIFAILAAIFLGVWTWFWTGPELRWEQQLAAYSEDH